MHIPKLDYEKTGSLESWFSAMSKIIMPYPVLLTLLYLIRYSLSTLEHVKVSDCKPLYISGYHGDHCDFINCDSFDEFCVLGTCHEYHNNVTECECDDGVTGDNCEILKHCDLDCGDNGTCDSIFNQGKAF